MPKPSLRVVVGKQPQRVCMLVDELLADRTKQLERRLDGAYGDGGPAG